MVEFLRSNPLFLIAAVLVGLLIFVSLFLSVKGKPKAEPQKEEKVEEPKAEEEPALLTLVRKKDKAKKLKKTKEKPTVEKLFEKKTTQKEEGSKEKDDNSKYSEEEFLKDKQFVKTSKTVSKVKKLEQQEEVVEEVSNEDKPIISYSEEPERRSVKRRIARQKHGHFDKSRRLKRCIDVNDFDDMFCSHISDDYLNFDVDTHLRNTEIITDSLYKRASQTLANSSVKILGDEEEEHEHSVEIRSNKDSMKAWIETKRQEELSKLMAKDVEDEEHNSLEFVGDEEDVGFDMKNVLLVDSIMKRKTLKKNKNSK